MSALELPVKRRVCRGLRSRLRIEDVAVGANDTSRRGSCVGIPPEAIDYTVGVTPFWDRGVIVLGGAGGAERVQLNRARLGRRGLGRYLIRFLRHMADLTAAGVWCPKISKIGNVRRESNALKSRRLYKYLCELGKMRHSSRYIYIDWRS